MVTIHASGKAKFESFLADHLHCVVAGTVWQLAKHCPAGPDERKYQMLVVDEGSQVNLSVAASRVPPPLCHDAHPGACAGSKARWSCLSCSQITPVSSLWVTTSKCRHCCTTTTRPTSVSDNDVVWPPCHVCVHHRLTA